MSICHWNRSMAATDSLPAAVAASSSYAIHSFDTLLRRTPRSADRAVDETRRPLHHGLHSPATWPASRRQSTRGSASGTRRAAAGPCRRGPGRPRTPAADGSRPVRPRRTARGPRRVARRWSPADGCARSRAVRRNCLERFPRVARATIRDSATNRLRASICASCSRVKTPRPTSATSGTVSRMINRLAIVMSRSNAETAEARPFSTWRRVDYACRPHRHGETQGPRRQLRFSSFLLRGLVPEILRQAGGFERGAAPMRRPQPLALAALPARRHS